MIKKQLKYYNNKLKIFKLYILINIELAFYFVFASIK